MRGDRLREVRESRGLTQADLAERVGIAPQQVLRYENGKNLPSSAVLSAFSKELEVSSDYLLGLVDEPQGWVKGRSRKREEKVKLPKGQIRQAIGLRGRIAAMPVGSEAGIFAPAAPSDTMRRSADQPYQVVNWDEWRYGQNVQGFSMMGRFAFEAGDWIDFSALGSDQARRVRILEIRQVTGDALTDDDLALLGYGEEEWKTEGLPTRRGWLMKVQVEREIAGKQPVGEPTIIHEDGRAERIKPADSIDD